MAGSVTLVIPAYNPGELLRGTVEAVRQVLPSAQIIVVDDGSTDGAASGLPHDVQVVCHDVNRGKGAALRTGFAEARSEFVGFIDADLQYSPIDLPAMIRLCESGWDAAIGTRFDGSSHCSYSRSRRWLSHLMQAIIRTIVDPRLSEAQAGIKVFRADLIDRVLPHLTCDGFAIDTEILAWSNALGFRRIATHPVHFRHAGTSTVTMSRSIKALGELWQIRSDIGRAARRDHSIQPPRLRNRWMSKRARLHRELFGHACRLSALEVDPHHARQELFVRAHGVKEPVLGALAFAQHTRRAEDDRIAFRATELLESLLNGSETEVEVHQPGEHVYVS